VTSRARPVQNDMRLRLLPGSPNQAVDRTRRRRGRSRRSRPAVRRRLQHRGDPLRPAAARGGAHPRRGAACVRAAGWRAQVALGTPAGAVAPARGGLPRRCRRSSRRARGFRRGCAQNEGPRPTVASSSAAAGGLRARWRWLMTPSSARPPQGRAMRTRRCCGAYGAAPQSETSRARGRARGEPAGARAAGRLRGSADPRRARAPGVEGGVAPSGSKPSARDPGGLGAAPPPQAAAEPEP
jgi:hypothetical protein